MLWIKDPSAVPRESWQYPSIAGPPVKSPSHSQLYGRVKKHYEANGQAAPTREEVDRYVCENLTVSCYEEDRRTVFRNKFTDPPTYARRGLAGPDWGFLLNPMKLLAGPDDRGLGDIIARTIGPYGGDLWKAWYRRVFGRDCGCGDRADSLNIEFPL